jgi:hypothetical protein
MAPAAASSLGTNAAPRKFPERRTGIVLDAHASASLRDKLLSEVQGLRSADAMTAWAQDILPLKNTLLTTDAAAVEKTFRAQAEQVEHQHQGLPAPAGESHAAGGTVGAVSVRHSAHAMPLRRQMVPRTRRIRDKRHLEFVMTQPCLVCWRHPCEAHHLRFAQPRALGRRVSDEFTVPLCRIHHDEIHRRGDEVAWWASINIDPLPTAHRLWQHTRGLLPADAPLSSNTPATSDQGGKVSPNRNDGAESAFTTDPGPSQR